MNVQCHVTCELLCVSDEQMLATTDHNQSIVNNPECFSSVCNVRKIMWASRFDFIE